MKNITYKDAGVNIDAGDEVVRGIGPLVASTLREEVITGVGGFASLVSLPKGYTEPVLVSGTDGVGTKLKIAFAVNNHRTVGVDLVAMCVNDILTSGAEPLFFLDYYACSSLEPSAAVQVVSGIAAGCREAGCALVGGETAELPGFYQSGEYDLAGFAVGVVERTKIITGARAEVGDAVLGIASSGLHSNGYSLVRAILDKNSIDLSDTLPGSDLSYAEAVLKPTAIYTRPVRALLRGVDVRALAHITGGGLKENIPRTLRSGLGVALRYDWPRPPIFDWLGQTGPVAQNEMLRTFNMGVGMTAVVPRRQMGRALELIENSGHSAFEIGTVVETTASMDRVTIEGVR